jgi:hypothetical protein
MVALRGVRALHVVVTSPLLNEDLCLGSGVEHLVVASSSQILPLKLFTEPFFQAQPSIALGA